jgi:hypothetical protein
MRDWRNNNDFVVFGVTLVLVFVPVFVGLFLGISHNMKAWDRYVVAHHCQVKGHTEPTNGVGIGSNGQTVVTYIAGQTIYTCDDGVIIIR